MLCGTAQSLSVFSGFIDRIMGGFFYGREYGVFAGGLGGFQKKNEIFSLPPVLQHLMTASRLTAPLHHLLYTISYLPYHLQQSLLAAL